MSYDGVEFTTLGIGCDIVAIAEIAESVAVFADRYLNRVFTDHELAECDGQIPRLAARFAAKEATVKVLAEPGISTPFHEVEVVTASNGLPTIALHGSLAARFSAKGWNDIRVSLSHTDCHAMAVVAVVRAV